jgi:predicted transcriptional regulator
LTGVEKEQLQKFVSEGLTNRMIAERLGRTEAPVRNIRYREGLKTVIANQLPELTRQRDRLQSEVTQLTQQRTYARAIAHTHVSNFKY